LARIGVIFGRATLDGPRLLYMPFALSTIKSLLHEGHEIDLYLCERRNEDYLGVFNDRVKVYFLDNAWAWKWGKGRGLYYLLNLLMIRNVFFKSYASIWGVGIVGSSLAGRLSSLKGVDYYYLSDEFPDIYYLEIWRNAEKRFARLAKKWIVPDESRVEVTIQQIPGISPTKAVVLPNAPLCETSLQPSSIDWKARFNIPMHADIVLYAGGIDRENNIELLLSVFPLTSDNFYLVMIGRNRGYAANPLYKHKRIIWVDIPLADEELLSLHQTSLCIIAFYSSMMWLEYVGKSSGKIMRAIIAGCPVITTDFPSLQFIKDFGFGVLIRQAHEIIHALNEIKANRPYYQENLIAHRDEVSFEKYWENAKLLKQ